MKRKLLFIGATIFSLSLFCFVACSSSDESSNASNENSGNSTPVVDESVSYSISFDTSNFSVNSETDQTVCMLPGISKYKNSQVTSADLPSFTVKSGYQFVGWYMDPQHAQAFAPFYLNEGKRLYAKFTSTSGEAVPNYILIYNSEFDVAKPKTTSGILTTHMASTNIGGYEKYLCGWFYNQSYTNRVMVGDRITKDTTLYGKWIPPSTISPGNGATFEGHEYVSDIDWYVKGTEANPDTRSKDFTKATDFSQDTDYHAAAGMWTFDNAVVYSRQTDRVVASVKNGKIKKLYLSAGSGSTHNMIPYQVGSSVDMTQLQGFIAVKATGAGTVSAVIEKGASSSDANPTGVAALVNDSGTILAAVKNNTSGEKITLSADVTSAGIVYLIYSRNDDTGGRISVYSMTFTTPKADYATLSYWTHLGEYYAQMSSKDSQKAWQYFRLDSDGINITRVASALGPLAYGTTTGRMYWSSSNTTYGYFFFVDETAYHTTHGALASSISGTLCTTWTNIAEGLSITLTSDGKVKDDINNVSGTYTNNEGVITVNFDASTYIFVYDGSRLFYNCIIFKGPLTTQSYSLIWES